MLFQYTRHRKDREVCDAERVYIRAISKVVLNVIYYFSSDAVETVGLGTVVTDGGLLEVCEGGRWGGTVSCGALLGFLVEGRPCVGNVLGGGGSASVCATKEGRRGCGRAEGTFLQVVEPQLFEVGEDVVELGDGGGPGGGGLGELVAKVGRRRAGKAGTGQLGGEGVEDITEGVGWKVAAAKGLEARGHEGTSSGDVEVQTAEGEGVDDSLQMVDDALVTGVHGFGGEEEVGDATLLKHMEGVEFEVDASSKGADGVLAKEVKVVEGALEF